MFGLGHIDVGPLLYGVVFFVGFYSMWWKLRHGKLLTFAVEVGVFVLVFKLHGGTMAGGFAATVAALLAGFIIPWTLGGSKK